MNDQHEGRRKNAAYYNEHITSVQTPTGTDGNTMIYNQYTLRTNKRDEFMTHLNNHKIGNAIYYPLPLHLQKCFDYLGYKAGDCPESEQIANEVVSIPVYSDNTRTTGIYCRGR